MLLYSGNAALRLKVVETGCNLEHMMDKKHKTKHGNEWEIGFNVDWTNGVEGFSQVRRARTKRRHASCGWWIGFKSTKAASKVLVLVVLPPEASPKAQSLASAWVGIMATHNRSQTRQEQ